jgi:hypothetical protein
MVDPSDQHDPAETLMRCFDPDVALVEGGAECLILSPRWGRLRRAHPLLASSPHAEGAAAAWQAARQNLLASRDRSVQLAISTYQYRVRIIAPIAVDVLEDRHFDLLRHCGALLERQGREKNGVLLRAEALWIRSLPPDAEGFARFECGNTFLIPISAAAIAEEAKALL